MKFFRELFQQFRNRRFKDLVSQRLHVKYRLVVIDDESFEEKLVFKLSRMNVYVFLSSVFVLFFALIFSLIAFTPLREYIPGYQDVDARTKMLQISYTTDSLNEVVNMQSKYIMDLQKVLSGDTIPLVEINNTSDSSLPVAFNIQETESKLSVISKEDSLLRQEMEQKDFFALNPTQTDIMPTINFMPPVNGLLTNEFKPDGGHLGIDIVSGENEPIKAVADGMILWSSWTLETGNVIAIQHTDNWVSVYKHNSVLLKKAGENVKTGDAIAIIGNSGELSSGPHLHFELWHNQKPVNPRDFLVIN
ncbi:MAG: M23 family metallopeptidase [Bacteroidetes bacterium]|nr:M23 family metallopeptidase [Bacteroidota bacterium]